MPLNAQISLSIVAHETSAGDLSRQMRVTPAAYATILTDGTAANQAQVVWSDARTLAGSSETLTLSSLADTRDGASVTVALTAVKAAYLRNSHASISIVASGGPFGSGVTVAPGGCVAIVDPTAAGLPATAVTATASAGATYDIVLVGEGTVT